jgi:hypothetical protein
VPQEYFFPLLFVAPQPGMAHQTEGQFTFTIRRWETSLFDLASLATKQKLHLPYQLMDVFLGRCNCEVAVGGTDSLSEAKQAFESFRLGLYVRGVSPLICPFITTHSINEYSGINDRGVATLRERLPKGMEVGPTISDIEFEAWPYELSLQCIVLNDRLTLMVEDLKAAALFASAWQRVSLNSPPLKTVGEIAAAAPTLISHAQSVLHIWSGIESLFEGVSTEVSFRISLHLAQLCATGPTRAQFLKRAKTAYGIRSKIAHGSARSITLEQWRDSWELLLLALGGCVRRGKLPSEEELINEMFL